MITKALIKELESYKYKDLKELYVAIKQILQKMSKENKN